MQTHEDSDFLKRLQARADSISARCGSEITAGKPGEKALREWTASGVNVRQLPDDEQGILRISIGGGETTPVQLNYCAIRGDREACIKLLRSALVALQHPRGETA